MSFEQRNEYFCKAQTDMQMIYIEAEREVRQLKAENAKLRELVKEALMANKGGTFWEYFDPYSFWAGWCKDAHELGIEVDG